MRLEGWTGAAAEKQRIHGVLGIEVAVESAGRIGTGSLKCERCETAVA